MDGLPIVESCDGCGVCCMHVGSPPYHMDELYALRNEHPDVAADYDAAIAVVLQLYAANRTDSMPCAWFDLMTRRCRHWEHRPEVCREYERGALLDSRLLMRRTLRREPFTPGRSERPRSDGGCNYQWSLKTAQAHNAMDVSNPRAVVARQSRGVS